MYHDVCGTKVIRVKDFKRKGQTRWLCKHCKGYIEAYELTSQGIGEDGQQ